MTIPIREGKAQIVKDAVTGEWRLYWPNGWLISAVPTFNEAVRLYRDAQVAVTLEQIANSDS